MRLVFVMVLFAALSGCATKYSCGQFPSSGCQPVSTVYERTDNGLKDYRKSLFDKKENKKGRNKSDANVAIGRAHQAINYASPGDPILTKPVVMRILFNSWVDSEKDLNAGGFVYVRLRDSEWVLTK